MKSLELYKNGKIQIYSNILEAITKGTQLSVIKKNIGRLQAIALISKMIIEFQNNLNIENKMTSDQIPFCAEEIINIYWGFKIEEIRLFFNRASIGRYGKIYNRFDCMILFEMLEIYDKERESELLKQHQIKKSVKTTLNENKVPQIILDKIDELKKKSGFDYTDPEYLKIKSDIYKENLKGNKKDDTRREN